VNARKTYVHNLVIMDDLLSCLPNNIIFSKIITSQRRKDEGKIRQQASNDF